MMDNCTEKFPARLWIGGLAIVAAALLLYARSFGNDWTLDDLVVIVGNPDIRSLSGFIADSYPGRPLRELTFLLDHALFGLQPQWWHLQSILWHGGNAFLLFLLTLRLGLRAPAALAAAALFLAHPLQVEAVANLANRKDPLALAFALLALLAWLRAREDGAWRWRLAAAAAFVAACLAKETAYALPLVILLHEAAFVPREERLLLQRPRLLIGIVCVLAVAVLVWFIWLGGQQAWLAPVPGVMAKMNKSFVPGTLLPYLGMMFKGWGFMFAKMVWPTQLAAEYVYPAPRSLLDPLLLLGVGGLGGMLTICIWAWRRARPFLLFGLGWFLCFWLPVANLWPLSYFAADRYYYAPLAGLALLAAAGLDALSGARQRSGLAVVAAVTLVLSLLTWQQNGVWRNQETLWTQAVAVNPTSTTALTNLGVVYLQRGDFAAARPLLEKAAANLNSPMPWYHLGRLFELSGERQRALQSLQTFLTFNDPTLRRERDDALRRIARLQSGAGW